MRHLEMHVPERRNPPQQRSQHKEARAGSAISAEETTPDAAQRTVLTEPRRCLPLCVRALLCAMWALEAKAPLGLTQIRE